MRYSLYIKDTALHVLADLPKEDASQIYDWIVEALNDPWRVRRAGMNIFPHIRIGDTPNGALILIAIKEDERIVEIHKIVMV